MTKTESCNEFHGKIYFLSTRQVFKLKTENQLGSCSTNKTNQNKRKMTYQNPCKRYLIISSLIWSLKKTQKHWKIILKKKWTQHFQFRRIYYFWLLSYLCSYICYQNYGKPNWNQISELSVRIYEITYTFYLGHVGFYIHLLMALEPVCCKKR